VKSLVDWGFKVKNMYKSQDKAWRKCVEHDMRNLHLLYVLIPRCSKQGEALLIFDEFTASHNVSWRLWCDLGTDHVVLPKSMVISVASTTIFFKISRQSLLKISARKLESF